jgi:hypothetical protein
MLSSLLMSFAFAETSLVSLERLHAYATLPSEPRLRHGLLDRGGLSGGEEEEDAGEGNEPARLSARMRVWSDLSREQEGRQVMIGFTIY